jgi:hypothetical protein
MYTEITKVKKLTIAQCDNNMQLYFDAVTFLKLHIDQKDPTVYTKDAFICNIFLQLKNESLPEEFCLEFSCQETCWMMNKSFISLQDLIDDASAYYVNPKNTRAWKIKLSKNSQIITLTNQLTELKTKIAKNVKRYLNKLPLYSITNKDVGCWMVMEKGRHSFCLSYLTSGKSSRNGATYSQNRGYPSIPWKGAATNPPGVRVNAHPYLPVEDSC